MFKLFVISVLLIFSCQCTTHLEDICTPTVSARNGSKITIVRDEREDHQNQTHKSTTQCVTEKESAQMCNVYKEIL